MTVLQALAGYDILDTPREREFDDVADLVEAGRHHHGRRASDGLQARAAAKF